MAHPKFEIDRFVEKLKSPLNELDGPFPLAVLRERQEAADIISKLSTALAIAEKACDKALAGFARWQSGRPFDPNGPEAAIRDELHDVIRPGARDGLKKLNALIDADRRT